MTDFSGNQWISASMEQDTSSLALHFNEIYQSRTSGSGRCSEEVYELGNNRNISFPIQRLSLKVFYDSRTQQTMPSFGLHQSESIHSMYSLQNRGSSSVARTVVKGRLHVQVRSERCLRDSTNSPKFSRLSYIPSSRHSIQIQAFSLWPQCCTSCVLKANEICFGTSSGRGKSDLYSTSTTYVYWRGQKKRCRYMSHRWYPIYKNWDFYSMKKRVY